MGVIYRMCNAMEEKLVTVVIPIYGVEKYLDRCINSVVGQTYGNLDILLVDDGSKDNCPQMCDAWAEKDSRIRVIHKENAGLGMARNTGIENARGDYLCIFDSDDYVEHDTIEKAVQLAVAESAEIVVFGFRDVGPTGNIVNTFLPASETTCFRGEVIQNVFLPDLIDPRHRDSKYPNLLLSAWCCLYHMDLIRKTRFRFVSERQNISEDSYSLIWLYRYVQSVALLPEAKYYYCKNEGSLTQTYRPERFERIFAFYRDTQTMAAEQGYGERVMIRISGLFLSFIIAAIKQTVAADIGWKQKRASIASALQEPLLQQALADAAGGYSGRTRRIILWAMRHGFVGLIILLALLQNRNQK